MNLISLPKFQQIDPAVLDTLRESNSKLGLDLANAEQQLGQVQSQLVEATEAKLRSVAELNQAREELAAQLAEAAAEVQQKKASIEVSSFNFNPNFCVLDDFQTQKCLKSELKRLKSEH